MKTVWKYTIRPKEFTLPLPVGAKVLYTDVQRGEPQMWVLVDDQNENEERTFCAFGTGHEVPLGYVYIDSFLMDAGYLVWHLFEKV